MKNLITLLAFISALFPVFAQQESYVEIEVQETFQLKAKNIILRYQLNSDYLRYYEEYGEYEPTYTETDFDMDAEFEYKLQVSPKSITKEMRKAYEDRQKKIEIDKLNFQKEREKMNQRMNPAWTRLIQILHETNIPFTIELSTNEYDYYEDHSSESDTLLFIVITSQEMYQKVIAKTVEEPFLIMAKNGEYESLEDKLAEIAPILTQRAQKQAEILGKSMNRKVGKILSINNIDQMESFDFYLDDYESVEDYYEVRYDNPYEGNSGVSRRMTFAFTYRFQIID